MKPEVDRCLSVRELARRWSVAPAKVRAMIRRGQVEAFNIGQSGRSQLRITPEAVKTAEQRLKVQKPMQRRRHQFDAEIEAILAGAE